MYYLEYSQSVVDAGLAPALLCQTLKIFGHGGTITRLANAERVYTIDGNTVIEVKNRYGINSTSIITDEDKVVLKLKAVLI